MNVRILTLAVIVYLLWTSVLGAEPPLLELQVGPKKYVGKVLAHDQEDCWFLGRDGRLDLIHMPDVQSFREIPGRFRKFSPGDLRDQLAREFAGYDVVGTSHYLVCGARGQASEYARIFEEIYRSFQVYFSVRGIPLKEPEFPLVAIVFPSQSQFAEYCRKDGIAPHPGLMGYYFPPTNRVALFDSGDGAASQLRGDDWVGEIDADLRGTIVHEATHQVAFNTGVHLRIGQNPKWVVEGLATVFEADGVRDTTPGLPVATRVNRERYIWFCNYARSRRPSKSLEAFIRSDDLFRQGALDAYSQAWALTFFLVETRPAEYARYLKLIAGRNPLDDYKADDRLADFRKAFGNDLTLLEADLLRFIARLQ